MTLFLPITDKLDAKERRKLEKRFETLHDKDIEAAKEDKIAALELKNAPHQQGTHSEKSVLDEPYSITDILKGALAEPIVAQFTKKSLHSIAYRRVYELQFDQYIGKRHPSDPLNCDILQIVIDDSDIKTYAASGKSKVLVSFSTHQNFTLPRDRNVCVSNENCITKAWPGPVHDHRKFFFSGKILRPLDNRKLGAEMYTKCLARNCFSCNPYSYYWDPSRGTYISYPGPNTTSPSTATATTSSFQQDYTGPNYYTGPNTTSAATAATATTSSFEPYYWDPSRGTYISNQGPNTTYAATAAATATTSSFEPYYWDPSRGTYISNQGPNTTYPSTATAIATTSLFQQDYTGPYYYTGPNSTSSSTVTDWLQYLQQPPPPPPPPPPEPL